MLTIRQAFQAGQTYIKRTQNAKRIYLITGYCKMNKAYECQAFDDISAVIYLKADKPVFIDFEF